jgi:hypothetical protein
LSIIKKVISLFVAKLTEHAELSNHSTEHKYANEYLQSPISETDPLTTVKVKEPLHKPRGKLMSLPASYRKVILENWHR